MTIASTEKSEALASLSFLAPNDTVYTVLRHCSSSGMSRSVSLFVPFSDTDGKPRIRDITWLVARALSEKISPKHRGINVSGCGTDVGFELVYNLGYVLWPAGTPEPHGRRNGEPDSNGGYALKQQWL